MKKALLTWLCMAAVMAASMSLKAQEVTVTLMPGWTWISVPITEVQDFTTTLGSFTPMTGDIIKSQWGNASYTNGQWRGNISQFYPGYGYMYKSTRTMPVTVTFNAQQPAPQVVVTTSEPMLITAISAMGGGEVTTEDGIFILAKGLCWATHENPTTNEDYFLDAGSGVGSFTGSMTDLNISTTYYVRAYAVTADGTTYGDQKTFTTRDGIPTLTTDSVMDITGRTASCGGNITDNGGLNVTARGVCWSTSPNPTIADSYTTNGSGIGSFSSSITGLSVSTTYYVRAYATTNIGTVYGNELSFTTQNSCAGLYVDLGLPSGTLWATCNVGANAPEEYGDYFAWGETQSKDTYNWSTYQYCNGSNNTFTKYCNNSSYGYNGFTDNLTTLLPEDDAATANWGGNWRMPTQSEWQELIDNTTVTRTYLYGVFGRLFTASNGNSLFLPAAGCYDDNGLNWVGNYSYYWSSSLSTDIFTGSAWRFYLSYNYYYMDVSARCYGYSVRAVRSAPQNNTPIGAINGLFTVNATGDQVYFSQGNLQYQASTNTWKFAENQWDYVGDGNANISPTYDGWIDLFGWGTSGYHDSNDPYNVNYQPWSSSTSLTNNNYNPRGYGPSVNMPSPDLTNSSANYDWGVYNPISNGGNAAGLWRTLIQSEWDYVLNTRNTESGIRYVKAKVCNINGLILLPDDWSADSFSFNYPNNSNVSFSDNDIYFFDWEQIESNGAVFLPAAGTRNGTSFIVDFNEYWSASNNGKYASYCLYIDNSNLYDNQPSGRCYGNSVRLVQDYNP